MNGQVTKGLLHGPWGIAEVRGQIARCGQFRVTQVEDIVRGVHAMIPKNLFAADLRR
jgi:hypothetical protein